VGLFDTVSEPADLDAVFAIEMLTNDRLRDEVGEIQLVAPTDRIVGPGATLIMAAFTHRNPLGSRFSNGDYGVYYCADSREAALAEVTYHKTLFLQQTDEPPMDVDMRLITANVESDLHDLLAVRSSAAALYSPDSYAASQPFGARLREMGSAGVVYESVRYAGGACVGAFLPRVLSKAVSAGHLALHWDGKAITYWFEKGVPVPLRTV